jgi:nucleoside-diphosphate-sugar epimerase
LTGAGRLAVTGANGFVGRRLVAAAARKGWGVVGVVRSESGARTVEAAGGRAAHVPALEPGALAAAFAGARAVVHLAHIGSEHGAESYESVNVRGTQAAVDGAIAAGVPLLVLFSGLGVAHYGQRRHVTNGYFLSKLQAELALFRSDRQALVFRPSYIVGPGDGLVRSLLRQLSRGEVEVPGDGSYRLQPVFVDDGAEAVLAGVASADAGPRHRVLDLVGPRPVTYLEAIRAVADAARARGRPAEFRVRHVSLEDAERQARAGGYRGMPAEELDCLLCDEVADPGPLQALLGRPLTPLDRAWQEAVGGATA